MWRQCAKLVRDFSMAHLSAGDLLRAHMTSGTPDGQMVADMIKQGQIVPSHVTISLLEKAIVESGKSLVLIDGFPRNEENRAAFEKQVQALATLRFSADLTCDAYCRSIHMWIAAFVLTGISFNTCTSFVFREIVYYCFLVCFMKASSFGLSLGALLGSWYPLIWTSSQSRRALFFKPCLMTPSFRTRKLFPMSFFTRISFQRPPVYPDLLSMPRGRCRHCLSLVLLERRKGET